MATKVKYRVTVHWSELPQATFRFLTYKGMEAALAVAFEAGVPVTVERVEENL